MEMLVRGKLQWTVHLYRTLKNRWPRRRRARGEEEIGKEEDVAMLGGPQEGFWKD